MINKNSRIWLVCTVECSHICSQFGMLYKNVNTFMKKLYLYKEKNIDMTVNFYTNAGM